MPTIHTITVRVTSQIDLAKALMYFVTVTPVTLKVAIEKIPKMQNNSKKPFAPAWLKYMPGFSKKGIPAEFMTQASTPKEQGTKDMIRRRMSWMDNPKHPSYPTIWSGSIWYFDSNFSSKTKRNPLVKREATSNISPIICMPYIVQTRYCISPRIAAIGKHDSRCSDDENAHQS